jgi:hypothetical protein
MSDFAPKTAALLRELEAQRHQFAARQRAATQPFGQVSEGQPLLGCRYQAGSLPPGSVVTRRPAFTGGPEYVIGRSGLCMRWEQPIPLSDAWLVTYAGRLAEGEWMTPRERAEVDEARAKPMACCTSRIGPPCGHRRFP